jgi:glutamine cyclotransferase
MAVVGCTNGSATTSPVELTYEVIAELPTDPTSFTQGLEYSDDGRLFESSGGYGRSSLRQVDPTDGTTIAAVALDPSWFAEGITMAETSDGEVLVLITWKEGIASYIDPDTLTEVRRFRYDGEGWGVCSLDTDTLVMTDGSSTLWTRNVDTFAVTGSVDVTLDGKPVDNLNELECVDGLVWANVWQRDVIVVIDPGDGTVVGRLDASGLLDRNRHRQADVLNGIAAVPGTDDQFLLAGKLWPSTWLVRVTTASLNGQSG